MPPRPASPKPAAKKKDKEKGESTARAEGEGTAREGKKPAAKKAAAPSARKKVDEENLGENYVQDPSEPPREPDRLRVFLKISAETGNSVSSCVACESKSNHAWALDFDGQRAGAFVTLDGVFSQDVPETHMYPLVVQDLVNEFVTSKRGVATLMTYGQSEAGREALMYGEAGSRVNLTPRALPAPHHIQQQRAPGIVPAAFKATLAHVPTLINAGNQVEVHMGCVMLHMELLRDLLSPQSRVHLIESPLDGVQLDGLHWQAITDVKEAEGLLQLATQNKAVHTMQADNGFLDACHIITAIKLTTLSPEGSSISKLLYMVELAAPPLPRPSGVPGLNVEDFCALNSSLRGLIASLGAMARKGNSRPPLRDSKLTRILSGSFGKDHIRCHLFICVSQERQHAETTAELLSFGALAKCAKLGPNIYEAAAPRALCSQLQADLATIELPNEETYNEMCDQMKPQPAQLEKLAAAAASLRNKHQQAIEHMLQARGSFENQLQHLSIDSDGMQLEVAALSQQNDALRRQVRSVRQGEGVEMAMDALRESDERELSALSKQVNALQERLNSAKQEQARLHSQDQEKGLHALVDVSQQLVELGRKYTDKGMYAQALPVLQTALLSAEVGSSQNHKSVVGALAALADLHIQQRREEEAIVLLKRAYTVDKEALGPDAPEVGHHLIGLGTAYHQQGKLEAAALTLEEARSILVYALGEKDEQVLIVKEKIKKLSVIEFDFNSGASGSNSAANSFAARMEARLAQKAVKADQLNLEAISKKQIAADLRRHGLLSARGTKAGEHFNYASHVAERVATEQEKRAAGERREMLTKKKQIFRERLRKRSDHGMNHDDDSDNFEEEEEERPETFAALEAEMMQVLGRSTKASQTEDWTEVVDCATQMEQLMHQVRNKSKGAACALRVLRSGVKPVGQDESRARSALAVLMMLEWCVPVCDSAFRQALAGERWVRRLVELARKDSSEKALVRATVSQLIVNWNSWYGLGFAQGVEMLAREGYALPECTRMQDGTETPRVMVSPDSNAGPLILGGLQNSLAGTFAKESTESEEHVKQEMAVMRDDLELLRHAVQARKAGKLEVSELAEARQAANDCSGWLQRLGGLLGSSVGGQTGRTHRDSNNLAGFSEATKEALRVLQQEMAELHRTFQAAYPGRKGFAMSGTPRASKMAGGAASALLHLGQTPRTRELFMSGAGTGDGTDRAAHGSTLSDFFGVTSTGASTQSSQQLRARSAAPTALEQQLTRREDASTARGEIDGQSPPHNSPRGNDSPSRPPALKPSGGAPVVPKLRLGGGMSGDSSARAAPVPPVSVPKINISRTTEPSQRSARGAGIPTMTLPPAKLDLGAQLEAALAEDDDIRPRADDSNQMFMQEVAILQMQAEGWKAEWSIAMQENERLRMALFDAESALEQLPPKEEGEEGSEANEGADDEMQWRELCTSIARAADEEKATLLEELNMVRAELEHKRSTAFSTHDDQQRAEVEANKARANADNWRAQYEREQEELERLAAQLKEMQSRSAEAQKTARGNEQSSTGVLAAWREANKKRNEAEAKLHTKKREAEAKLTTVYNEHRQQLEKLQMQIQYKKSEQSEIMQQMNRWRTQWEEEMSEKNAVAAELLTLRSEFEKSSGTYDKEIEGLKDMLERTRAASAELRDRWEDAVQRKNAILGQLDDADKEMQRAMMSARGESRSFAATAQRLNDAKAAAEKMKAQADQAEADRAAAEKDLVAAKEETSGNAIKLNQDVEKLREKLTDAKMQVEVGESRQQQLDAALRELEQAQGEKDAVASDAAQQAAGLAADAENLQKLLEKTRAESLAKQQSASALRAERDTLSDELAGLKAEVEELTVSHDLEVERLQERLGQLQTVQDKLELSVSEKRKEHEKALLDMDMQEEQKMSQMTEQYDSATFNLKESQSMLRDAKAALKKEQKAKQDAEDIIKETKADLEQVLKESKVKEAELQSKLTEEGTLKERLDASLAADRVQSEEAVATLKTQLTEAKKGLRESEAKATEFAKEYGKEFYLRKQIAEQLQEMTGGMRVFCRVRPLPPIVDLTPEQISAGEVQPPPAEPCCKMLDETTILHEDKTNARHPRKRFEFNQVYGPAAEQSKLFDDVRPMIGQTLHGFNVSCIVYGARGSGKTYTLEGTPDEPGLVLRSVNALFEEISDGAPECMTFEAFLSVVDILDEKFRDLLLPEGSAKQELVSVTRDATYGVRVEGATIAPVRTASHVRSLLAQAQAARQVGGREHDSSMVTMLTVRSANTESGESSVGKLTLVDLAAAQPKLKKDEEAPADQNVSLAALTEVIDTLSAGKKKKVDFEASKLTELLQDSLSGNSKSMMLLCVDADPEHATITSQCLTFAEKAKGVKLGAASKNKESMHTAMNKVNTTMSALTQHAGGGGGQNTARKQ